MNWDTKKYYAIIRMRFSVFFFLSLWFTIDVVAYSAHRIAIAEAPKQENYFKKLI